MIRLVLLARPRSQCFAKNEEAGSPADIRRVGRYSPEQTWTPRLRISARDGKPRGLRWREDNLGSERQTGFSTELLSQSLETRHRPQQDSRPTRIRNIVHDNGTVCTRQASVRRSWTFLNSIPMWLPMVRRSRGGNLTLLFVVSIRGSVFPLLRRLCRLQ